MQLREKINEVRQAKRVPIERIVRTGISKNKYYRFISGESSISIGELQKLIEVLTVSLSELIADSDERDRLIFNEFGDYLDLTAMAYKQRAKENARRYMQTNLTVYYIIAMVYELGAAHKNDEDVKEYVDELYDQLKRQRFFTILELQIYRILVPYLSVTRFFKLYPVFTLSLKTYETYNPADVIELIVKINATAMSYAVSTQARARKYLDFVLTQISNVSGRPFAGEFSIMKRLSGISRLYLMGNVSTANREFDSFFGAAKRLQMEKLYISPNLKSFDTYWKKLTSYSPDLLQSSDKDKPFVGVSEFDGVSFSEVPMGPAFEYIMKLKKLVVHEFEIAGMSHSKIYRVRKNLADFDVNDLFAAMMAARLDVRDVDVYLATNTNAYGRSRFGMRYLSLDELKVAIKDYEKLYQETQLDIYKEISLEFKGIVLKNTVPNWLLSDELAQLSQEVTAHLSRFDIWHEAQHRLAGLPMLHQPDTELIKRWMAQVLSFSHHLETFRYPYNPILINYNSPLIQAILVKDTVRVEAIYARLSSVYENTPAMHKYFNYRWHMKLNEEFMKIFRDGFIVPMTIENFLHDLETLTGNQKFIVPYREMLNMLKKSYPMY
ncbi:helix-turn-helix transcriptional regulator [Weissella cibaria]|uniref:helix-turn-helix domain-containing protein n=1 Tax=Weissella cibaria TaxID=137591 RepID=UPI000706842B|nr:helix-turn-helix transcriptional regulator [Weissella cibaria]ALI33868.1 hypothetical protein AO080_10635 [Weissella cibaria]WCE25574.1 helix-turn-helix transcriptional regulator [Weissella cibaria]WCE27762.1 helix-turn-helix transcriptional regulator [Weissella cibaria]HCU10140.1 XRE family transcriptional regulator [Weissella cibaria]